ncbi:hypothetical protein ACEWY4_016489 [Coilia grayii]|uniref:CUB domain-containing protein n=1 Tax=Coilia grayii TaxID=363190 RepID=A0ABD1JLQ2_9TELE
MDILPSLFGFVLALCVTLKVQGEEVVQCGGQVDATSAGYITSPGYPLEYPPYQSCQWVITAPEPSQRIALNFNPHFEMEKLDCRAARSRAAVSHAVCRTARHGVARNHIYIPPAPLPLPLLMPTPAKGLVGSFHLQRKIWEALALRAEYATRGKVFSWPSHFNSTFNESKSDLIHGPPSLTEEPVLLCCGGDQIFQMWELLPLPSVLSLLAASPGEEGGSKERKKKKKKKKKKKNVRRPPSSNAVSRPYLISISRVSWLLLLENLKAPLSSTQSQGAWGNSDED